MAETKQTTIKRADDGTITLSITVPASNVEKAWEEEVQHMVKPATLPGFREGKAPRKLVEEKLDKEKIREEVLKKTLPSAYLDAIKAHGIPPIINPKIHVEKIQNP